MQGADLALLHTPAQACQWLRERVRGRLCLDSRRVTAGDGFLAVPGARVDGRRFLAEAVRRGAAACLLEADGSGDEVGLSDAERAVPLARLVGLRLALGTIASSWWQDPSARLGLTAVTGTNGKTSTTWWLAQAWSVLPPPVQRRAGVIGTLGAGLMRVNPAGQAQIEQSRHTGLTTPDPVELQECLHEMLVAGSTTCAMEASSIGIVQGRLEGVRIDTAVLTNFTQDHLDYHGDMESYWRAKRRLFDVPALRAAVLNIDDARGAALASELADRGDLDLWTTSCTGTARLRAIDIRHEAAGLAFDVCEGSERAAVRTQVIGEHNAANLLEVLACLRSQGVALTDAAGACRLLTPVPGRLDCVIEPGQPLVAVDYAHTPDALATILRATRRMAQERGGRLWCVFGCGGNRDATKRPLMGAVARMGADEIIVTSDNPRDEKPEAIIAQILTGAGHDRQTRVELNRARAISTAVAEAAGADVVVIAGKGHENTQEIAGVKRPFSDLEEARAALARRPVTRLAQGAA